MSEQHFITRPMSIALDVVRFASAFMVMLCHAGAPHIYGGNFPLTLRFSHNCVVIFFVLSGLVISASVTSPSANLKSYAIARAARILPVAIPAVIFSGLVFLWLQASKGPLSPDMPAEVAQAGLLGMVFLSEGPFGSGVYGNLPYWSLSYEVWYYVLFGAVVFLKGWLRWPG